jgi:tetratricopeptide (TPR) repeat protein
MKVNFFKNLLILIFFLNISNFLFADTVYFNEGKKLFEIKKYKDAKFKFEKDIVFNPKNEESYLYLAKIFNKQNETILEENNLNTVILLNPKNEEAIYYLALLSIKKSDFSRAKKLIKKLDSVCVKLCLSKKELLKKIDNS